MFKNYLLKRAYRFRRFCHKAYATFCSLHREVTIGRIAGYMTDLEMLKQGRSVAVSAALLCACAGLVEADEGVPKDSAQDLSRQLSLQEVLVVSHKAEVHSDAYRLITQLSYDDLVALPIHSVADILQYLPGVDVRTRGARGAQADISMRGGTFDQVLVLLNGIPLNDAQTGHYTLNMPVSTELIERIEVLQGTSSNLVGAFSGAINIVTKSQITNHQSPLTNHQSEVLIGLTSGMNGLVNPEVAASIQAGETQVNLSADYSRAEGYYAPSPSEKEAIALRNSDFQEANIYTQVRWQGLDVQAGAQWKNAGLGMGYGFGSQDQFDATRTLFTSARYTHRWNAWRLDAQAAYRANYDRYEWHRGTASNRHWNHTASAAISAHYASRIGTTSFGIGARNENISSSNLGNHNRLHLNYFAEQTFYYAGLSASLGVNGTYNTQFGYHMGGSANIGYEFVRNNHLYLNANRSLRMPTFTDLYYDAGNQLGNPALKPEEAWLLSFGYKGEFQLGSNSTKDGLTAKRSNSGSGLTGEAGLISVALDGYYRNGRNIIDWVYVPEDTKRPFHAANQQKVNAAGLELSVAYRLNEWLRCVSINYAYTYLDLDLKQAGSRYLDYLSHKLIIRLEHGIYKGFGASWTVRFQKREGQYNEDDGTVRDFQPVWLLDGSVFWQNRYLRISAECTNMTNTRYYDYGGVLQPGAWALIAIQAKL
ncbi:MAG: TonB-dependent receptor [Paludibacteraceae bacterium]|nr:TonB-dependent receptor [Paludibacteraceae bacterium]